MASVELPPHVAEDKARLLLAIGLFQEEGLTVGRAADVAGLGYRAFVDALVVRSIPPYSADEDPDTLAAELRTVRDLVSEVESRG